MNPDPEFRFEIGQLVRHRRYGYRGVVFDRDAKCEAEDEWYENNQTQPPRDRPWYHVLVDGREHSTYAAQSNLEADPSPRPVNHPWLEKVFSSFVAGRYYKENVN